MVRLEISNFCCPHFVLISPHYVHCSVRSYSILFIDPMAAGRSGPTWLFEPLGRKFDPYEQHPWRGDLWPSPHMGRNCESNLIHQNSYLLNYFKLF